jgi:sirohydrochlorin ferrochelatase
MLHHLEMSGITRGESGVPVQVARAMDDAPELAEVVTARALAMAAAPPSEAVFIVGHGPSSSEQYAAWMENLRSIAGAVEDQGGFRSVLVDLIKDDAPAAVRAEAVRRIRELIELQYAVTGRDVIVVPLLIAPGSISRQKLPADLAGLPIRYSGETLLPNPAIARWVEASVRASD